MTYFSEFLWAVASENIPADKNILKIDNKGMFQECYSGVFIISLEIIFEAHDGICFSYIFRSLGVDNFLSRHPIFQKNICKAWEFTRNKLCQRYFDNNLQKIFEQIFLRMAPDRYFW